MLSKKYYNFEKSFRESVNHVVSISEDNIVALTYLHGMGFVINDMLLNDILTFEQGQSLLSFLDDKTNSLKK